MGSEDKGSGYSWTQKECIENTEVYDRFINWVSWRIRFKRRGAGTTIISGKRKAQLLILGGKPKQVVS